jgi:hypothetical protein
MDIAQVDRLHSQALIDLFWEDRGREPVSAEELTEWGCTLDAQTLIDRVERRLAEPDLTLAPL